MFEFLFKIACDLIYDMQSILVEHANEIENLLNNNIINNNDYV